MQGQDLRIGFDSELTIRHAAHIKGRFAEGFRAQPSIRLAVNPDAAVDISFVQLVSAARLHAGKLGGTLSLAEPAGPNLRDVLQRAGFIEGASPEDLNFWLHSEYAQ